MSPSTGRLYVVEVRYSDLEPWRVYRDGRRFAREWDAQRFADRVADKQTRQQGATIRTRVVLIPDAF